MNNIFVIMQDTRHGPRYFLGGYPEHVDSWVPDIRKAAKFTQDQVTHIREHCQSHTSGMDCKKVPA